jgi:luciferase family oxidoreductase group 1
MMTNLAKTKFSILDLARYSQNATIQETYHSSKILAQNAERWGYERFWLAEHHNLEGVASAATSILIGYIAENTKHIRVGSGGIMLPNHAPLVIAEQFGTLATLYPNRIDLGLGRAPGTDQRTMWALRRGVSQEPEDFGKMIEELLFYLAPAVPGQKIKAIPGEGMDIPIWILGSSLYSAQLAAQMGRPYAFAGHFAPAMMMQALDIYRSRFRPSEALKTPYVIVGVPMVAAETDERAEFLATSLYLGFLGLIQNKLAPRRPPIPVEEMEALWSPEEKYAVMSMLGNFIVGGPEKLKAGMEEFIAQTGANELMITSDVFDSKDRLQSFELIAQAANLQSRS